ncbi:MAG: hypothetical protein LUG44_03015 [Clostridiales bacterium]|nr:hypothetical protein [Clostridiales bacterium]
MVYTDGTELVEQYNGDCDIIFMDVQMQYLDGMTAAVYNIVTIVLNGGVSMVVFFVLNKIIFAENFDKKK